jgi:hypothetical protein
MGKKRSFPQRRKGRRQESIQDTEALNSLAFFLCAFTGDSFLTMDMTEFQTGPLANEEQE